VCVRLFLGQHIWVTYARGAGDSASGSRRQLGQLAGQRERERTKKISVALFSPVFCSKTGTDESVALGSTFLWSVCEYWICLQGF